MKLLLGVITVLLPSGILARAFDDGPPTDYASRGPSVQVVYGEVLAWEELTKCGGKCDAFAGGAVPLLKVRVTRAFSGRWKGDVVFEVPFGGTPYPNPEKMETGRHVMVTFIPERSTEWACGDLRSCKTVPRPNPRVLDIFRVYQWP